MKRQQEKNEVERKFELTWEAPEFLHHEKTIVWHAIVILVGIIIFLIAAFVLKNLFFSLIIIVATVLLITHGSQHPHPIQPRIDSHGVHIDQHHFYHYDKLHGFSTYVMHPEITKDYFQLVLHSKSRIHMHVKIFAPAKDLHKIRNFLLHYIPELEYTESLVDHLAHIVKF